MAIKVFRDKHLFLSPRSKTRVEFGGFVYNTVEAAYQASKTEEVDLRKALRSLSGAEAAQVGKLIKPPKAWFAQRVVIMGDLLWQKFGQDPDRCRLLETDDEEIVRENDWGDTFWGVCKGVGENIYGKLVMEIRGECWTWDWQPPPSKAQELASRVRRIPGRGMDPSEDAMPGLRRGERTRHRTASSRRENTGQGMQEMARQAAQQQNARSLAIGPAQLNLEGLRLPGRLSIESVQQPEHGIYTVFVREGASRAVLCTIAEELIDTCSREEILSEVRQRLEQAYGP